MPLVFQLEYRPHLTSPLLGEVFLALRGDPPGVLRLESPHMGPRVDFRDQQSANPSRQIAETGHCSSLV